MSRVVCVPKSMLPQQLERESLYYTMYEASQRDDVGTVGTGIIEHLLHKNLRPSDSAWDFSTLALAVVAADSAVHRSASADGWTRAIELEVAVQNPAALTERKAEIQEMLRFLSGDFWHLTFLEGGRPSPVPRVPVRPDSDCVCLLSGGVDSLIGAINLAASGRRPFFVSQLVKGNRDDQLHFARRLNGGDRHLLCNSNIRSTVTHELSTRARSIVFYGFACMVASALSETDQVELHVPENGFISLNVPLSPGRIGSLSTKTTHPVLIHHLQGLWSALGIAVRFHMPFKFLTKGEILLECKDAVAMGELLPRSTSCGKFGRLNEHCGRCLPCLVRRAAFLRAEIPDPTPSYRHSKLTLAVARGNSSDVQAAAIAYLRHLSAGSRSATAGALSFADANERALFERVVDAGINELGQYLQHEGVI